MKNVTRKCTLTAGLPGSGKGWAISKLNIQGVIADPDKFKEAHPDYDPKNPAPLHAWSNEQCEKLIEATLAEGKDDLIIDGTGVNAEKMVRRMEQAREAGYSIDILYVKVDLEVALKRNSERERTVPEHIVIEKSRDIETSMKITSQYADKVTIFENN